MKTIEHGSYLTEEAIELMLEKVRPDSTKTIAATDFDQEAILVPTRYVQQYGIEHAEQMAPESYQKMAETVHANKESYRKAVCVRPLHDGRAPSSQTLTFSTDQSRRTYSSWNRSRYLQSRSQI